MWCSLFACILDNGDGCDCVPLRRRKPQSIIGYYYIWYFGILREVQGHLVGHRQATFFLISPSPTFLLMHVLTTCLCKLHGFIVLYFYVEKFGSYKPLPLQYH